MVRRISARRVVVEAFATGTPLVATDIGGLREAVTDGVEGLKFRPGSAEALADAATRLWHSPELRAQLRATSRCRFEREYAPGVAMTSLRNIYDQAMNRPQRLASCKPPQDERILKLSGGCGPFVNETWSGGTRLAVHNRGFTSLGDVIECQRRQRVDDDP